jgi:hypothetical protein
MKTIDFIKKIKDEGNALTVYHIQKMLWEDKENCDNPMSTEDLDGFYYDMDAAKQAMKELDDATEPEFGVRIEFCLDKAEIGIDDLNDVDWDNVETTFGDSDLLEIFNSCRDYEESIYVDYPYKSVDGALLVFWSWNRYIGYARDLQEIREGYYSEDESLCIKEDKVFVTQCDVLIEKQELEGLSKQERRQLIEKRLGESHWKWTMKAEAYIRRYIRENFEKVWSNMSSDEQELNVRQMNDTYNFATDYDNAKAAAAAVRTAYENDPAWFGFVVDDLDEFEQDIEENVDYLYF